MESVKLPWNLYQKHNVSSAQGQRASGETKSRGQSLKEIDRSLNMRKKVRISQKKLIESFERSYIIFSQGASVSLLTLVTSGGFLLSSFPALRTHPTEH